MVRVRVDFARFGLDEVRTALLAWAS